MKAIENEKQYEAVVARIEEFLEVVDNETPKDDKNSIIGVDEILNVYHANPL